MMRVGDLAHANRLLGDLMDLQSRTRRDQVAVSSGRAVAHLEELGDRAASLLTTKQELAGSRAFATRAAEAVQSLQVADGSLGQLQALAERFRALLVHRLGGDLGGSVPLGAEAANALQQVQTILNQRYGGSYLFGGSRSDVPPVSLPDPPPVVADPDSYYRGDDYVRAVRVDVGAEVAYGIRADEPPFATLIGALGAAAAAEAADDRPGLEAAFAALTEAIGLLADRRSAAGVVTARLEAVGEAQRDLELYLDQVRSGIEDTDLAAAMTRLSRNVTLVEASMLTLSRVSRLSLLDYLR
jgi:flagellar hook-associated protein 3 FlgL